MKDRLYFFIYKKCKIRWMAQFMSCVMVSFLKMLYFLIKILKTNSIDMSYDEAKQIVCKQRVAPEVEYKLETAECDENLDLSILVPVYNSEDYIQECIDSILNQTTSYKYEIVVVNDGSKDNSLGILERFGKQIVLVNQANGGIANARNAALNHAKGKYFMFVDSDDLLVHNSIENLMQKAYAEDADIVACRYYLFYNNSSKKYFSNEREIEITNENIPIEKYPGFPWGKVYKRELFDNVRFFENYLFEDTAIQYSIFSKCKRFIQIKDVGYAYRKNYSSISFRAKTDMRSLDTYWIMEKLKSEINTKQNEEYFYYLELRQLSVITYNRIKGMDIELQKAVFVMAAEFISERENIPIKLAGLYKELYGAFKTKNFSRWKLLSNIMD